MTTATKTRRNWYHEANRDALKRVDPMLSGQPDPGPLMTLEDDGEIEQTGGVGQPSGDPPRTKSKTVGRDDLTHPTATADDTHAAATHARELIPIEHLAPSEYQPRRDFNSEKLDELAASLEAEGINHTDLIVRLIKPSGQAAIDRQLGRASNKNKGPARDTRYEILAGERRWRAAAIAKLPALWCVVVELDDAAARRLCRRENLQREDLTDIERVTAYRDLLRDGDYPTQAALAESLGITPATLSNQLRVLDLPQVWLDLVSQEKLTLTHLRSLAAWVDRPRVLEAAKRMIVESDDRISAFDYGVGLSDDQDDRPPTVKEFELAVLEAVKEVSRPVDGRDVWERHLTHDAKSMFTITQADLPTPAMIKRDNGTLDVIDVKGLGRRAFNIDVWNSLSEHAKAQRAKKSGAASGDDVASSSHNGRPGKAVATKTLSAAEQREKAKAAAEQFAKRLARYRTAWLQRAIVERMADASATTLLTHALAFAAASGHGGLNRRHQEFGEAVIACGGVQKAHRHGYLRETDVWGSIASLAKSGEGIDVAGLTRTALATWYAHEFETSSTDTHADFLEGAAKHLGIDFATEWRLDREFLELCDKSRLGELLAEWKLPARAEQFETMKRGEVIDKILQYFDATNAKLRPNCPLPKCLAKLKP